MPGFDTKMPFCFKEPIYTVCVLKNQYVNWNEINTAENVQQQTLGGQGSTMHTTITS